VAIVSGVDHCVTHILGGQSPGFRIVGREDLVSPRKPDQKRRANLAWFQEPHFPVTGDDERCVREEMPINSEKLTPINRGLAAGLSLARDTLQGK
jgi:hypothetical protein